MKLQGLTIKTIVAEEGMLLTQAGELPVNERIFSSKVYDENLNNWVEWKTGQVEDFLSELQNEGEEIIK